MTRAVTKSQLTAIIIHKAPLHQRLINSLLDHPLLTSSLRMRDRLRPSTAYTPLSASAPAWTCRHRQQEKDVAAGRH